MILCPYDRPCLVEQRPGLPRVSESRAEDDVPRAINIFIRNTYVCSSYMVHYFYQNKTG